jgi:hypothetical protein
MSCAFCVTIRIPGGPVFCSQSVGFQRITVASLPAGKAERMRGAPGRNTARARREKEVRGNVKEQAEESLKFQDWSVKIGVAVESGGAKQEPGAPGLGGAVAPKKRKIRNLLPSLALRRAWEHFVDYLFSGFFWSESPTPEHSSSRRRHRASPDSRDPTSPPPSLRSGEIGSGSRVRSPVGRRLLLPGRWADSVGFFVFRGGVFL